MPAKTLVVTAVDFPPSVTGPAVLMGNLFRHFPKGSYCVLTRPPGASGRRVDPASKLDCTYHLCPILRLPRRLNRPALVLLLELSLVPWIAWQGLRIIRRKPIDNILTTTDASFEVAAFLMHKLSGKPLFVYLFDMYHAPRPFAGARWREALTRRFEEPLLRATSGVFVMSEPLREHYWERYRISAKMLPHPVDLAAYGEREPSPSGPKDEALHIVFTGVIYDFQIEPVLNLVQVVNSSPELRARLTIYTPTPFHILERQGVAGPNVELRFATREEIPSVQRSADILFLPMTFDKAYPEIVQTASPSKMPEYLAAGRPILVHAPDYSYISQYARQEGFALVVDSPDLTELKENILRLREDKELCRRLVANAWRTALRHDAAEVSKRLQTCLGTESASGPRVGLIVK